MIWQSGDYERLHFYYRLSHDRGETWISIMELPTMSLDDYYGPAMVITGSVLRVVWYDYTPGYPEICYKRSEIGGVFWNPSVRLTWTSGESCFPDIAVDSAYADHIVWQDNTPGNYEIYYKKRN